MNEYEREQSFDLSVLLDVFLAKWIWIVLAGVVCAVALWAYSTYCVTPMYSSSTSMYIYSEGTAEHGQRQSVSYSELYAAQQLADPYVAVLNSDSLLAKVIDRLDMNCSVGQMRRYITVTADSGAVVITVTVEHPDPKTAQDIAKTVAQVFPEEIKRVIKAGGMSVIDEAKLPTHPNSPNILRNTVLGAVFGLVVVFLFFLIRELTNSVIRSEEDIEKAFPIPVLGAIPQIESAMKGEKRFEKK